MTKNGAAHTHSSGPCACKEHPKQGFASEGSFAPPQPCPPPEEARLPGSGVVGLADSMLRLITPLILGLPVCLQGENSGVNPPHRTPSAPTPTLLLSLYLLSPSSSILFIPLSLCCQRH
ncbi:Hypothetical protein SMAX5B_002545 [Scophthalmus maximus]|uniref:Uncharacterized protein n=1 Tax=Scophthalmus maximus TaxID=52904 RepID=A0A2U9AX64_SCOMX|nr:Hypothetical protein SMAX5B_002545 [Scophthalmus maximus]